MKHIFIALSLSLLFFVTSCIGGSNKNGNNRHNQVTEQPAPEIVADLTQDYITMEENQPAINAEIKNGGLWLTFHKDQILPVGVCDEDSYRLPDGPVQVEGLKGAPKNFIVADIGQDYNPILCVLTDQNKVQILSLWDAVSTGDVTVTEIPMDRIVGFKDGPGGPFEDEDGTVFYDYTTIYGIDARGGEHEIPLYTFDNNLDYIEKTPNGDADFKLYLGDDWKMRYVVGYYRSEAVEELQGRFWLISEDWDAMVFRFGYELTTRLEFTGEGVKTSDINQKGVFEMQYPDFDTRTHIIIPIEGVDFANKGMNNPVPFIPGSAIGG
jgi:hypothetical protein